jgi:thiol-disulfide isomerase/thioredoxin
MVAKTGGADDEVDLTWEDLRSDAFQPRDDGSDPTLPEREYSVWMGELGNFYSHSVMSGQDGIAGSEVNGALRSATVTGAEGSKYFLVSARGANLEGTLGAATDGTERPGAAVTDLCEQIGYHEEPDYLDWTCGRNFTLLDEHGETHSLYDLRGHVIMLDFSAMWCPPCQSEADVLENLHDDYKDRGVKVVTVLIDEPSNGPSWEGRPTPAECRDWSDREDPNPDHTFTCFVDQLDSEGTREAWPNYQKDGSVPRNTILDRGLRVVYTTAGYPEGTIREQLDKLVGTADSCLQ